MSFNSKYKGAEVESLLDKVNDMGEIPTKVSQLENDSNYIADDVLPNGVYAVSANGKLIDYKTSDSSCLGVALVQGEHKFMIAKSDATNDGSNYSLYYDYDTGDLSLTNYSNVDGTNSYGYLGGSSTPQMSQDFTTWTAGALSDFNGKSNTQVIAASSSNAKDMCKVLETFNASSENQGHSDWYVPAAGQLALMYFAKTDINAALAKIGGTAFESGYYWSSSEYGAEDAWFVAFDIGLVYGNHKRLGSRVRFVRDISASKPLKERVSELESSKQDTLVSGTSIKTVNGTSILGSGNITISGGITTPLYPLRVHSMDDDNVSINPGEYHMWPMPMTALTITLAGSSGLYCAHWIFRFSSESTPTTLSLPNLQWANGNEISISPNKTYEVSITEGLAVWAEF